MVWMRRFRDRDVGVVGVDEEDSLDEGKRLEGCCRECPIMVEEGKRR
jgi:hypothetical protein